MCEAMEEAMRNSPIRQEYFAWITQAVCGGSTWQALLTLLDRTTFTYQLPMDENRAMDGCALRYRFGYEHGYSRTEIEERLDNRPCTVLEMMVALAMRCEEHIMADPDSGDRTGRWFFAMIDSLGLSGMDDEHFNQSTARLRISRFLRRDYAANGRGGLFTLREPRMDMRRVDIWYQAMWYLNETIREERT